MEHIPHDDIGRVLHAPCYVLHETNMTEATQEQISPVPRPETMPEMPVSPEPAPEAVPPESGQETAPAPEQPPVPGPAPEQPPVAPAAEKSELYKAIETALTKDETSEKNEPSFIEAEYMKQTEEEREKFKEFGEKISGEIEFLLKQKKVDVHKISELVHSWLEFALPEGTNKYFIQQQSTIIVGKILRAKETE